VGNTLIAFKGQHIGWTYLDLAQMPNESVSMETSSELRVTDEPLISIWANLGHLLVTVSI